MFFLSQPNRGSVDEFLARATADSFSYPGVGATLRGDKPAGYRNYEHNRVFLGKGPNRLMGSIRARYKLSLWF